VELTPPGDNYVDDCPYLAYFDGRIFVAWSSAETESFYSPARIYIRSWDGSAWSPMEELTPPGLNYINDQPYITVCNNSMLIFWRTNDPSIANSVNEGDLDVVYRIYDKVSWAPIGEFTPDWCDDFDWSITSVEYRGKLYVFWDPDVDMSPTSLEPDIYYRVFDGLVWSQETRISPGPDNILDECPEEAVYHNPVTGQDELWCFWIRTCTKSDEFDIMAKRFDGYSWGPMVKLTVQDDDLSNECQKVVEHDGRLYLVYIEEVFRTQESKYNVSVITSYGDIVIRSFDGTRWSAPIELTPQGAVDNATSPSIAIYNGKLYVAWAFPYGEYDDGWDSWDVIARTYDFRPVELEIDLGNDGTMDWGPSDPGPGGETVNFTADTVRRSIEKETPAPDGWGNEFADVQLGLDCADPSIVVVENLEITYSYTVHLENISPCLNDLLRANAPPGGEGNVTLPLNLRASSTGKIVLKNLNITYTLNFPPQLIDPVPDWSLPEDMDALRVIDLEQCFCPSLTLATANIVGQTI